MTLTQLCRTYKVIPCPLQIRLASRKRSLPLAILQALILKAQQVVYMYALLVPELDTDCEMTVPTAYLLLQQVAKKEYRLHVLLV